MRKVLAVSLASLMALSLGGAATAGKKKPVKQSVTGTVVTSAPYTDASKCFAGAHRRVAIMTDESETANGPLGYHFNVDKKTWGKKFKLDLVSWGFGSIYLDIYFYTEFGTKEDVQNDPQGAGAPAYIEYSEKKFGGEKGSVPKGMKKAIVCIAENTTTQGGAAEFAYLAGDGVK